MKRRFLWLLYFVVACFLILSIVKTYALFESNSEAKLTPQVGKWVIKLNDVLISEGKSQKIEINKFIYTDNDNVEDGYIAPGRSGYFDIVLDPTGTDVAIKMDVDFDLDKYYSGSVISKIELINGSGIVRTGKNKYTKVFTVEDMETSSNLTVRVTVDWQDDEKYDGEDTELGLVKDNKISIPCSVDVNQYFGEEIKEYVEPEEEEEETGETTEGEDTTGSTTGE